MRTDRLVILVLAGALLGGCAAAAGQPTSPRDALAVGCDEFSSPARGAPAAVERTVTATVGETFRITLCSNPSTGFAGGRPNLSGPAAIALVDRASVAPAGDLVGSAGSEIFTFRVGASGTANIQLAYGQPWAGGIKQSWSVNLTVEAS